MHPPVFLFTHAREKARAKKYSLPEQPLEAVLRLVLRFLLLRLDRLAQERAPGLPGDHLHRRLQIEVGHRRVPRRPGEAQLHRHGILRPHLPLREGRHGLRRERDGAGQIEVSVDADAAAEAHLRLRSRHLDGLLELRDAILGGHAVRQVLAKAGRAALSFLSGQAEGQRLRQWSGDRGHHVLAVENSVEHVPVENAGQRLRKVFQPLTAALEIDVAVELASENLLLRGHREQVCGLHPLSFVTTWNGSWGWASFISVPLAETLPPNAFSSALLTLMSSSFMTTSATMSLMSCFCMRRRSRNGG